MDQTLLPGLLPNLLNILLTVVFLSISLRAFFLYRQLHSPRLFLLGLAMGVIACTAMADFTSGIMTNISLNTDWFLFLGQAMSFLFVFLSLLRSSDPFLRRLILWQIISTSLVFFLLVLAPILPAFPNVAIKASLSGSRSIICFFIFGYYAAAFASKETRFSLLIGIAFLLLSAGYILILPMYFAAHQESLDQLGDIIRIAGLIILWLAYAQKKPRHDLGESRV